MFLSTKTFYKWCIRKYIFSRILEKLTRRHIASCKFIILCRMWVDRKYGSYLEEKSLATAGNWPVSVSKNVTDLSRHWREAGKIITCMSIHSK